MSTLSKIKDIPNRLEVRGEIYPLVSVPDQESKPEKYQNTKQGLGCCAGVVTAKVRVVTDPNQEKIEVGEILVAQHTDPGWITLFVNLLAIIFIASGKCLATEAADPKIESPLPDSRITFTAGTIFSQDGAIGSVIPLVLTPDSTSCSLFLTSAHNRHANNPTRSFSLVTTQSNFEIGVIIKQGKGEFEVVKAMKTMDRLCFNTYDCAHSFAVLSPLTSAEIVSKTEKAKSFMQRNRLRAQGDAWKAPSPDEFINRVIDLGEESYKLQDEDLTVVQSKKPVSFGAEAIRLTLPGIGEDLSGLTRYPAYAIGSSITPGKGTLLIQQKFVPVPEVHYLKDVGIFYSARRTLGGMDDQLITPGMSGGALVFKTPRGWIIGGVISETFGNDHIKDQMTKEDLRTLLPVYDIFQSFPDDTLQRLHALMVLPATPAESKAASPKKEAE